MSEDQDYEFDTPWASVSQPAIPSHSHHPVPHVPPIGGAGPSGTQHTQGADRGTPDFPAGQRDTIPGRTDTSAPGPEEEDEDYDDNDKAHPSGFSRLNEADLSERAGNLPDGVFTLPARRHKYFDNAFLGDKGKHIWHIARKTGTHISMPIDLAQPDLNLWGTPEQLQNARHDLHALLEQVQQDLDLTETRVGGWVKTRAMPSDRRQEILDRLILDAKIRKLYRRDPPEGFQFPAVGIFMWPNDGWSAQDSLGSALEMLDDIRFDQKVYILYVRKRNMLRVLGDDTKSVETAVSRIYATYCEIAAKNRMPTKMILVQPPSMHLPAKEVYSTETHDLTGRQITVRLDPENKGIQVFLYGPKPDHKFMEAWKTKRASVDRANIEYLKKALGQGLQDVAYYRGHTRLRVYIGRMVLYGYKRMKDGIYDFESFNDMAHDHRTAGEIIKSIGSASIVSESIGSGSIGLRPEVNDKEVADELINNCNNRPDIFPPVDANPDVPVSQGPGISEPLVCATFDIGLHGEKGRTKDIRLEVVFERIPGTKEYRPVHKRWLDITARGKRAAETQTQRKGPLDVKVIDLEADLAYQFEIVTWSLDREWDIYPIFHEFVRRLTVEEIPDERDPAGPPLAGQPDTRPTIQRISYMNLPGMSVQKLIQKTKWRYWMANTNYIFELTRYENLNVHEVIIRSRIGVPVTWRGLVDKDNSRWGCTLWNTDWDYKLSQQAVAEIGYRGNWEPDIEKFFESSDVGGLDGGFGGWEDEDGFMELMGRIKEGLEIIKTAQANALRKKKETEGGPTLSSTGGSWVGDEENDN
ncbi:hypothetical protein K440DRAFT_660295 [Wilcoxina mikolae CBS 423.85]|nr:hypothetical protein K440DRAFT_660295 [Wilcoxina mikolae CBS 423.85]